MSFGRKHMFFALSAAILGGAAILPLATGFAFESETTADNESDAELLAASGIGDAMDPYTLAGHIAEPTIALDDSADLVELQASPAPAEEELAINDTVDADLLCLAKIVRHEAANQSHTGQLAVAQLVMNRAESPRFPNTICDVAHQRGQFFNTAAYNPSRNDARWQSAMDVALDARNAVSEPVVGEAVFYHAAYAPSRFHQSRPRVTQIEDHIFYR